MKQCSVCKNQLPLTEFAFINKSNGKLHYQCNSCRRDTAKRSYQKNRSENVTKSVNRGRQKREWFRSLKEGLSCCACGETDPACLDFHHLNPEEKEFELGTAMQKAGKQTILEEISKCACLCANCHRKYHAGRLNVPLVKLDITQSYEV